MCVGLKVILVPFPLTCACSSSGNVDTGNIHSFHIQLGDTQEHPAPGTQPKLLSAVPSNELKVSVQARACLVWSATSK